MEFNHLKEASKGFFQLIEKEKVAAFMSYSSAGDDLLIIDHTEVELEYGGQGLGKKLLMEAVKFARENKIKILPLCPFAAAVFKKDDSIKDVLK